DNGRPARTAVRPNCAHAGQSLSQLLRRAESAQAGPAEGPPDRSGRRVARDERGNPMTSERSTDAQAEAEAPDPAVSTEHEPTPTQQRIIGADPSPPETDTGSRIPRMFLIGVGGAGLAYCIVFMQSLGSVVAPVFLALNLMVTAHPLHSAL